MGQFSVKIFSLPGSDLSENQHKAQKKAGGSMPTPEPEMPTFEEMAREWHALQSPRWAERYSRKILQAFVADVFPTIGKSRIDKVTAPDVLGVIRKIEGREAMEHARKVRGHISSVLDFAKASGHQIGNPASDVIKAMAPQIKGRMPAIVDLAAAREALQKVESFPARPMTRLAMRLLALTALRQGELRRARWEEFEGLSGSEPLWRVPADRMKMKVEHLVPLSRQAVELIAVIRSRTGNGIFLFPSASDIMKPMSENALGYLLNRAGFKGRHVPHGWRSSFSSAMNERRPEDGPVIELMLAHQKGDSVRRAYDRAQHLPRRRELAQEWADLITKDLSPPAALLDLPRR